MQIYTLISITFLSIASAFQLPHVSKIAVDRDSISHSKTSLNEPNRNAQSKFGHTVNINRGKQLRLQDIGAVEAFSEAFVGGTVGVMSVAFILELRKVADQRLDGCPYCMGNGEILCGICYGNPSGIPESTEPGAAMCACSVCNGRGLVQCINCKGDGRITPIILQSKAVRDPDYSNLRLQERNKK
jgi:hypothetical protein